MKRSTKILVGGVFLVLIFLSASAIFQSLGIAFGPFQMAGSAFAGLMGGSRLVS